MYNIAILEFIPEKKNLFNKRCISMAYTKNINTIIWKDYRKKWYLKLLCM